MGKTVITAEMIQARILAGVESLDNADYAAALKSFEGARGLMAGIPRFSLVKSEIEYTPDQLDATIERVRLLKNQQTLSASGSSGGIVSQPTERIRYRTE